MFKKAKANKEVERVQNRRRKEPKQKVEKETKQKAKKEKRTKNVKKSKTRFLKEEVKPLQDVSISTPDAPSDEEPTPSVNETDPSVENDSDQEQENVKPKTKKCFEEQSQVLPDEAKNKDNKATPEQQDDEKVVKGRAQRLLFGKTKLPSLGQAVANPDGGTSEIDASEGLRLIHPKKRASPFFKMNDWIQKKMTQKPNFRKRISSLTKAVGITHWLRTIKQKQSSRRSGGHVVSHRMTMRVACKTSLARKQKQSLLDEKDTANPQDEEATEDTLTDSNKELDAKYAVVLPRVKKLAKAKTTEAQQPVPYASDSPGGDSTPKARPPKPGAKLVLPSKPDLSLLKSGRNPLLEKLRSDEDVDQSVRTFHDDSTKNRGTSGTRSKHQDGVSVLQAARENLKPSQIKMPVGLLGTGLGRPKGVRVEAEVAEQTQISQSFANEDTSLAVSGVPGLYEEEADREVALLMGGNGLTTITQPEFHWTGNYQMTGDPQVCICLFKYVIICSDYLMLQKHIALINSFGAADLASGREFASPSDGRKANKMDGLR